MDEPTGAGNLNTHERIVALLHEAAERDASDVHLVPGHAATLRVHGRLETCTDERVLEPDVLTAMLRTIIPENVQARLGEIMNADFSTTVDHDGETRRFRSNVYYARGALCACLRHIPTRIPSFDWMGFSASLAERLIAHRNGMVIITGVTGSGKSTTLAGLVNLLNQRGGYRIITVEEPIEYVHPPISSSMVTQREVGRDVDSFLDGLKYGLRQDPDVILVGEIRDQETARMALSAAETGHLILTTLHTQDAKGAITRFVDLFPHEAQGDVRTQLSLSLRSVVSQHLVPSALDGQKRALALEVMHVNQQVRIAIKFGKIDSIESAIQTGKRDGLIMLDDDLQRLVKTGLISNESARHYAKDPDALGGV